MLRISKLTDYGVVLSTRMATMAPGQTLAAVDLARETGIPQPTVSKVLKRLGRAGIVESQRGAAGGYRLARPADRIPIAEVITALEGPIGVTECASDEGAGSCEYEGRCDVQGNWQRINAAIEEALRGILLSDMTQPPEVLVKLGRAPRNLTSNDGIAANS